MDVQDLVRQHYGDRDLGDRILNGLREVGIDTDKLTIEDLAALDQLHAGFLPATRYLLERLELDHQTRLLDVGCGIGGPSRVAAATYACPVIGIDLSPDFIRVGQQLTERVGLAGLVDLRVASGDRIDLADASLDRAMIIHVGMNIPDKAAVFAEVRRVLKPGAIFGVYEQMQVGSGVPNYPLPWAEDEQSSFVATPEAYTMALESTGFVMKRTEDRRMATAGPPGPKPRLSPAAVFGPSFAERIANNIGATRAGILAPIVMIASAI
jgi:SAM-dependent methyltransferase